MISFSSGFLTFLLPYLVSVALTCLVGAVYGGFSEQTAATLFQAMGIHILFFFAYGKSVYSASGLFGHDELWLAGVYGLSDVE